MKIKILIIILISIIIFLLITVLNLTIGLMVNPPQVKVFESDKTDKHINAVRGSYSWRFLNRGIAVDCIYPTEMFSTYYQDFKYAILNTNPKTDISITFPKAWVASSSIVKVNDNGEYEEQQIQQQYGWNYLNLITEETGKYIYIINLVYPQGSVSYSFMLNVI